MFYLISCVLVVKSGKIFSSLLIIKIWYKSFKRENKKFTVKQDQVSVTVSLSINIIVFFKVCFWSIDVFGLKLTVTSSDVSFCQTNPKIFSLLWYKMVENRKWRDLSIIKIKSSFPLQRKCFNVKFPAWSTGVNITGMKFGY